MGNESRNDPGWCYMRLSDHTRSPLIGCMCVRLNDTDVDCGRHRVVLTVLMRANPGWQGVLLLNRPPDSPSWGFFGSSRGGGRINLLQERELPVHHTSDFSLINNCALSAFSGKLEMGTGGEFECNYLGDELVNNGLFCFHDMSSCLLGKENVQNTHLGVYFSSDFCSGL